MFLEPTCPFSVRRSESSSDLLDQAGEDRITIKLRLQSQPWHMYSGSDRALYCGRLDPLTAAGGEVTAYAYDPAGQLIKLTRPDGSFFTYTYDAAHRLTGIADAVGDRVTCTCDAVSNVTMKQILDPGGHLTRTRSYACL